MGKSTNGLGQFIGKVGSVVFSVADGEQIVRAYQPNVKNPRSSAQLIQRAKVNVAGKLSSIVPQSAILGLKGSGRKRRGLFLGNLLRAAQVTEANGVYTADIAPADIVLSQGVAVPCVTVTASYNAGAVTLNVSKNGALNEAEYERSSAKYVVIGISNTTGYYDFVAEGLINKPAYDSTSATTQGVIVLNDNEHSYLVYVIPITLKDGYGTSVVAGKLNYVDNAVSSELAVNESSAVAQYGNSQYISTVGTQSGGGSGGGSNPGGGGGGGDDFVG